MTIKELILGSEEIVKQLTEAIDRSEMSLKEAEKKILEVVNRIGQLMVNEVVAGVKEPVLENQVEVDGETVVFNRMSNLRFINRFGGQTERARRAYKYEGKSGGYYRLDEKLGMDRVVGEFSSLLTYLQVLFGVTGSYERSEELLSEVYLISSMRVSTWGISASSSENRRRAEESMTGGTRCCWRGRCYR